MLEDDDDETVTASNVSEGYYGEDYFGMEDVPPTTQHQKPVQITKMVTRHIRFSPKQPMGEMRMEFHCAIAGTPVATKCRHCFQHHATETRSGVHHIGLWHHRTFFSARSTRSELQDSGETHHHYAT